MNILILGAGQVGGTLAESLLAENHNLTLVDVDGARLAALQERLDVRTVQGPASLPSVLRKAGVEDADMLVAVTRSDEANLVACKLAADVFHVPVRVARIRAADYLGDASDSLRELAREHFGVDHTISPEREITGYLARLVEHPEALQVVDFADGRVRLVAVRATRGGALVGHELRTVRSNMPRLDCRVVAIYRKDRGIAPQGSTVVELDDEVFFLARRQDIAPMLSQLRQVGAPVKRVMIAGGGNIGRALARLLERHYQVKLIDHNKANSARLAEELVHTLALVGDATDEDLLEQENIGDMDVFCALTNDDEDNIMAALLAKRMGAKRVIALINRASYVDLVQGGKIDIAISPAQATVGPILSRLRRGDMAMVHSLRRGAAEALEVVVHGDRANSRVVGRRIGEIPLPEEATIGALVRGNEVLVAHHDTLVESGDHVILFVLNKRAIPKVERLFQVGIGFF